MAVAEGCLEVEVVSMRASPDATGGAVVVEAAEVAAEEVVDAQAVVVVAAAAEVEAAEASEQSLAPCRKWL